MSLSWIYKHLLIKYLHRTEYTINLINGFIQMLSINRVSDIKGIQKQYKGVEEYKKEDGLSVTMAGTRCRRRPIAAPLPPHHRPLAPTMCHTIQ